MIPCYLDKNGNAIKPGMKILMADGSVELVYETTDEFGNPDLGISATNKALDELEAFIQGTEMAIDYGQRLPEGDFERYEAAIARRSRLTAMLDHNDKPETDQKNEQKTVPKERGDSR